MLFDSIDLGGGYEKRVYCNINGGVDSEEYWLDGEPHREDGPAIISYHSGRGITYKSYWLNGKQVTKEEVELYRFNKQFDKEVEEVLK
jgi:hypothetical protein